MSRKLVVSLFVLSCGFLILAASGISTTAVTAQTTLDDVHIAPRERSIHLASIAPAASGLIRTRVDLVMVPVTITDGLNRPVVGLNQENFQLFEGKSAQRINSFSSEDAPVSIGILLDVSGSMKSKLDRAREAVAQFCDAGNPLDEFFLITFADSPQLTTDFTGSAERIQNDILMARSKGQTSLLDGIYLGLQKLRDARYPRRALLIISDGGDNHSRYSEREVKAALQEANVTLYAVGTFDAYAPTQEEVLGPQLLQTMAQQTGGRSFILSTPNEMPGVTRAIGTQLRHQYMLAYRPETVPRDGKWHKINVKLRLPKNIHSYFRVDSRRGYYSAVP